MKRTILITVLVIAMLTSNIAFASGNSKVPQGKLLGVIHEDGSYQFSDSELKKLDTLLELKSNQVITISDIISYCAPEYYSVLPNDQKAQMRRQASSLSGSKASNSGCSYPGVFNNTGVTLEKYGSSLKSTTWSRRADNTVPSGWYLFVENYIFNTSGRRMAYSINAAYQSGTCTATNIIDPPTGTYYAEGWFEIPYYCVYHAEWFGARTARITPNFSYANPWG